MRQWEYTYQTFHYGSSVTLDDMGKNGWELVTVIGSKSGGPDTFYFKREIEPEQELGIPKKTLDRFRK